MKNKARILDFAFIFCLVLIVVIFVYHFDFNLQEKDPEASQSQSHKPQEYYYGRIELAGEWFLNNQNEDFIFYEYDYLEEEHPKTSQKLREMGALWSIARLAHFLDDQRYESLANKGLNYFEESFEYDKENDFAYVNINPKEIKLGYSAFAILTLLEMDHPKKAEYLKEFGDSIVFHQKENGELQTFFYSKRETGKDYYPGEALLALMSLYEHTGDEEYLKTVQKAFPFYVEYFRENPNTAFVPWQSRAYNKLYKATQDQAVADFLFEMNDYMIKENRPQSECSNFDFPRGIVTAVFAEGVTQAYEIAKEVNDQTRASCYSNYVKEGINHILKLQITENPEIEAIGGFIGSQNSQKMRVDNNQHAALALIDAYELGIIE